MMNDTFKNTKNYTGKEISELIKKGKSGINKNGAVLVFENWDEGDDEEIKNFFR